MGNIGIPNPSTDLGATYRGSDSENTNRVSAVTYINTSISTTSSNCIALRMTMAHEISHTFGVGECPACSQGESVMSPPGCSSFDSEGNCTQVDYNNTVWGRPEPSSCDNSAAELAGAYDPDNLSQPPQPPGGGGGCPPDPPFPCSDTHIWDPCLGQCVRDISPIVIDTGINGFNLTSRENGVSFDMNGDGRTEHLSWTAAGSDDAWLALDRNNNGTVDNGAELFGNFTSQPPSSDRNGFLALTEYDKPTNGGNSDGVIDNRDAIFSNLRLWQDTNHNGISEATELKSLPTLNVTGMELRYVDRSWRDEHGNNFRYHSVVYANRRDPRTWRWASDVFLDFAP